MFQIQCNNKGCFQINEAQLDPKTDEVICSECSLPIGNVSIFAKRQLKSMGQILRKDKVQETFGVACPACKGSGKPISVAGTFVCKHCQKPLNLSETFKNLLKQNP